MLKKSSKPIIIFLIISSILYWANFVSAQNLNKIEVTTIKQFQKVAPGESLPIAIKLLNMGGSGRVDVELTYKIEDANKNVLSEELETVAVETTANFIKQVKIPPDLKPGKYFLFADLKYPDQKVPAVTRLPFQVEYKFLGFFLNQLIILATVTIIGIIIVLLIIYFINKSRKIVVSQFAYQEVSKNLKPYYELISDIILTMRLHIGDKAINLANKIDGLKVSVNGEVLEIKKEPAEIVTLITVAYQNNLNFQGLNLSQKALNKRIKRSGSFEDRVELQKTSLLLDNVVKFFVKNNKKSK